MQNKITLILGGARSGKSAYAEKLAMDSGLSVTYIATAQVYDEEFKARVQQHKDRRPSHWQLIETPHYLALSSAGLRANSHAGAILIVDCLTLWLGSAFAQSARHQKALIGRSSVRLFLNYCPHYHAILFWSATKLAWVLCRWARLIASFKTSKVA